MDSYSYWFGARAIAAHGNPYDAEALAAAGRMHDLRLVAGDAGQPRLFPYIYPPPLAGAWRVFLPLSPVQAHRVLEVLGALLLGVALWALDGATAPRRHRSLLLALFTVTLVVNGPAVSSTRLGQLNAPLLAAIAFAVWRFREGRDTSSAATLAAAALVKLTPGLVLLGLGGPAAPRWRAYAVRFLLATVTIAVLTLPLAPAVHWAQFADSVRQGLPWGEGYSLTGWIRVHAGRDAALSAWKLPLQALVTLLLLALAWRHQLRAPAAERALEGSASAIVVGLLISPITWQHHYLFFMLPAWVWIARAWAEDRPRLALAFAILSALVLLRLPGSLLVVRPFAASVAFGLATLGPCSRDAGDPAGESLAAGSRPPP